MTASCIAGMARPTRTYGHAPFQAAYGQQCSVRCSAAVERSSSRKAGSAAFNERRIVLSALFLSPLAAAGPAFADATAACEFAIAPNGIQYCDTQEGTGPEPVKGSLIR